MSEVAQKRVGADPLPVKGSMKIYQVEVLYRTVIRAESKEKAESDAEYVVRYEDCDSPESVYATEIRSVSDLPSPWDKDCRPWGERELDKI